MYPLRYPRAGGHLPQVLVQVRHRQHPQIQTCHLHADEPQVPTKELLVRALSARANSCAHIDARDTLAERPAGASH